MSGNEEKATLLYSLLILISLSKQIKFRKYFDMEKLLTKLRSVCPHLHTHDEDWPNNDEIEVCNDCGMSRYIKQKDGGSWSWVENLPKVRQEIQKAINQMRRRK